jgi:hypothetical protein
VLEGFLADLPDSALHARQRRTSRPPAFNTMVPTWRESDEFLAGEHDIGQALAAEFAVGPDEGDCLPAADNVVVLDGERALRHVALDSWADGAAVNVRRRAARYKAMSSRGLAGC